MLNVCPTLVEEASVVYEEVISSFLRRDGLPRLFWFHAHPRKEREKEDKDDAADSMSMGGSAAAPSDPDEEETMTLQSSHVSSHNGPSLVVSGNSTNSLAAYSCCYFLRINPNKGVPITEKNIDQEVICGVVNGDLLHELMLRLEFVFLPALRAQKSWGELSKRDPTVNEEDAKAQIDTPVEVVEFFETCEKVTQSLRDSMEGLKQAVQLVKPAKRYDIDATHKAYTKAAMRPEVVQTFKETVEEWTKQIEALLSNGGQAGPAASEELGPNAEVHYWKMRMTQLNSITDQLKGRGCKVVLSVLNAAKHPMLDDWKALDIRITDAANEAKDNVKYLGTLGKFSEPLYKSDPVQMLSAIPALINAIKMMHSIARYYNTSEKMTSLFVKITSQMIQCCKKYIDKDGALWDQDLDKATEKLKACIDLNEAYHTSYRTTKEELATNLFGKQFDFSEQAIFGKFDLFCARLAKLIDVLQVIKQFSALSQSNIENIEPICMKFEHIVSNFRRKNDNDYLDVRKNTFDGVYLEFKQHISELSTELVAFINNCFLTVTNTTKALSLLAQFRSVMSSDHINQLLDEKHTAIFHNYGRDLEIIKTQYEKLKERPTVPRNTPPVAGAIAWARQLLRQIENPMAVFQDTPSILQTKDAKRIIRTYNKVAKALVTFEDRWYEKWCEHVALAKSGLTATLLVLDKSTSRLYVNFDKAIFQLIREVRCLQQMHFAIPVEGVIFVPSLIFVFACLLLGPRSPSPPRPRIGQPNLRLL